MTDQNSQCSFRAVLEQFQSSFRSDPEQFWNSFGAVSINFIPLNSTDIQIYDAITLRAVSEQFPSSFSAVLHRFLAEMFIQLEFKRRARRPFAEVKGQEKKQQRAAILFFASSFGFFLFLIE